MSKAEFEKNVLSLSDPLFRLAKSILYNEDDARDALQELTLRLWERRMEFADIDNIQAFVFRSMRNFCLDVLRKRKENTDFPLEQEYNAPNPYQSTETKDMANRIQDMINRLPELQRTVIRMRDIEELEIKEIAYIMDLTENAVNVNLSRARQSIRERLLKEQQKTERIIWK